MENFIRKYRQLGYPGLIQAVKISISGTSWLYDSRLTLAQNLKAKGFTTFQLTEVEHYVDAENNLDIVELRFTETPLATAKLRFINRNSMGERDPTYHLKIRKYIGTEKLFYLGMTVIIENDRDEVAIARRADDKNWTLPAGLKELNESILDTVRNETREKLNLEIEDLELLAIFSGDNLTAEYAHGDVIQYFNFFFKAKHVSGELRVNDAENIAVEWIDKNMVFSRVTEKYFKKKKYYENFNGIVAII